MAKGDIALIPFPFTDLTGSKLRPAVILIDTNLDLTVCFITSQIKWAEPTDVELLPLPTNGIKKPSLIRVSKIATIDRKLAVGKIGTLEKAILSEIDLNLKVLLKLTP
jgi:mRNA interferase MazF